LLHAGAAACTLPPAQVTVALVVPAEVGDQVPLTVTCLAPVPPIAPPVGEPSVTPEGKLVELTVGNVTHS